MFPILFVVICICICKQIIYTIATFCILGVDVLKQYNIRIDTTDIEQLDQLGGCRSEHIRIAITKYIQGDIQSNTNNYDNAIIKDYIEELKADKDLLQRRLDYFMLPWFKRIMLPNNNK